MSPGRSRRWSITWAAARPSPRSLPRWPSNGASGAGRRWSTMWRRSLTSRSSPAMERLGFAGLERPPNPARHWSRCLARSPTRVSMRSSTAPRWPRWSRPRAGSLPVPAQRWSAATPEPGSAASACAAWRSPMSISPRTAPRSVPVWCCCSRRRPVRSPKRSAWRAGSPVRAPVNAARARMGSMLWPRACKSSRAVARRRRPRGESTALPRSCRAGAPADTPTAP